MKKVILLSGPYGVGKTTLANNLANCLDKTMIFDGEWAWFQGNNWNFCEENKKMALDNICYVLNNFLKNSQIDNIVFSWVMHKQQIHDYIISSLNSSGVEFELYDISLIADEFTLKERLQKRISSKATEFNAFYDEKSIEKALNGSLNKLNQIIELDTIKVDVSNKNQEQVLTEVLQIIKMQKKTNKIYILH